MKRIEAGIELAACPKAAYDAWAAFEKLPEWFSEVKEVRRLDGSRLYWRVELGGRRKEWIAELLTEEPGRAIAWRSVQGWSNRGEATFQAGGKGTWMRVVFEMEPEGLMERMAFEMGIVQSGLKRSLERFRKMVEETGAPERPPV